MSKKDQKAKSSLKVVAAAPARKGAQRDAAPASTSNRCASWRASPPSSISPRSRPTAAVTCACAAAAAVSSTAGARAVGAAVDRADARAAAAPSRGRRDVHQLAVRRARSTARRRPEAPSFVEVGQPVRKGQVVCIVEAMKLMNEIEAESDGKIVEILVENGEHVEYGAAPLPRSKQARRVQEGSHSQPRRDRAAGDPRVPRDGHRDGRGALDRRRRVAARPVRRREGLHRPAAGARRATCRSRRSSAPPR